MDQEAERRAEEESADTDAASRGDRGSEQRDAERPDRPADTEPTGPMTASRPDR